MHLRTYISGVVAALCAADGVLGQNAPQSQQTRDDVATIHSIGDSIASTDAVGDNEPIKSYQHNNGHKFAQDDLQDEVLVQESKSEDYWISSSESVPVASQELDTASPHTALFIRQDDGESIPSQDPNALPIEPKITPAIGIAGAIMLGTGVALCLVGVKKSWLHIFLSTGYLASLAVTVLIIYVMNPEHSNAIQGAYMVAAVVTGLIFGAVSLVFQEVTEGLGCMLGSFCFAMWILVLAPGGVIHSTAGRGILIGVITVAGFGLSFTHYTRMYALLCCTSFAGATITILGVDCFSRAGLKEFWLFLWKLNPKQFPLETKTYPITRGIRVEIACIIVVFLLGLVSQFKLWKVIKARRAQNEAERKRVEDERLEAEAAVGRDIEANNQRERAEWEAMYGEKHATKVQTDSCAASSMETSSKHQYSVKERELDTIELSDIEEVRSGRLSSGGKGTMHEGHPSSGESQEAFVEMGENSRRQSNDSVNTDILDSEGNPVEEDNTDGVYAPGAPEVVPLPFRVPTDEEEQDREAVAPSEASKKPTDAAPAESVVMPLQKLSLMQLNQQYESEAFERRADQASSVAATADDVAVLGDVTPGQQSRVQSMLLQDVGGDRLAPPRFEHDQSKRSSVVSERELEQALDEDDEEALPRDPVVMDVIPAPNASGPTREKSTGSTSNQDPANVVVNVSRPDGSSEGHPGSVSEGLVEQLPAKLSKIALTYRTNEWAKHIADADHPDNAGELERPSSPGVQVETSFPEETPRPVDVEELQKTNSVSGPNLPTHSSSKASKKSQRQKRQSDPVNNLNRSSSTQSATPIYAFSRSSSQVSLNRQQSTSGSPARPKLGSKRQSSMQLTNQTLVESPVEDATETFQPNEFAATTNVYPNATASTSASNLLDERNQMLQRRPTTVSFNGFRSTPSLGMMSGAIPEGQELHQPQTTPTQDYGSPTFSSPTIPPNCISEDENMTLAQRRSLMQLNANNQTSPTLPSPQTPHKPRASILSTLAYDSHQPARTTPTAASNQQSARLNQWRQTLQADVQAKQPPRVVESAARQNMMDGRRANEQRHARKKEEEGRRQSAIDEAMRRGQLDGAHRDAMRRLQARASGKE